jgi:hypothetical protein
MVRLDVSVMPSRLWSKDSLRNDDTAGLAADFGDGLRSALVADRATATGYPANSLGKIAIHPPTRRCKKY